jgi:hypothetical protein
MASMPNIAEQFINLVLKHRDWELGKVSNLLPDEAQVFLAILLAAGFDPKEVAPGKLGGHFRDEDGPTGETYPINRFCPFKVTNRENNDDYRATDWLDRAFRRVVSSGNKQQESIGKLIEAIAAEIEQSIPLQPIQLTPEGDLLCEYPPSTHDHGHHARDDSELRPKSCVGVHKYCNGFVDRMRATETHDAIHCRNCHLHILFPKEVQTYGELRQAMEARQLAVQEF